MDFRWSNDHFLSMEWEKPSYVRTTIRQIKRNPKKAILENMLILYVLINRFVFSFLLLFFCLSKYNFTFIHVRYDDCRRPLSTRAPFIARNEMQAISIELTTKFTLLIFRLRFYQRYFLFFSLFFIIWIESNT